MVSTAALLKILGVVPGRDWDRRLAAMSMASFDPFFADMGIDLEAVQEIRPVLVEAMSQHVWNREQGWNNDGEVLQQYALAQWFLFEERIPISFKRWFYGWQWHNSLLRHFQFTDLWRFLSFYRQNRNCQWAQQYVTPWMDQHYLPSYKAMKMLRGVSEPWLPEYLVGLDQTDAGDLVDICQEHLQVWQLRRAMVPVLADRQRASVLELEHDFMKFCAPLAIQKPQPIERIFSSNILVDPSMDVGTL